MHHALHPFAVPPDLIRSDRQAFPKMNNPNLFSFGILFLPRNCPENDLFIRRYEPIRKILDRYTPQSCDVSPQPSDRRADSKHGQFLSFHLLCNPYKFGATSFWGRVCKHMWRNIAIITTFITALWLTLRFVVFQFFDISLPWHRLRMNCVDSAKVNTIIPRTSRPIRD
jgi:hypothetical protein